MSRGDRTATLPGESAQEEATDMRASVPRGDVDRLVPWDTTRWTDHDRSPRTVHARTRPSTCSTCARPWTDHNRSPRTVARPWTDHNRSPRTVHARTRRVHAARPSRILPPAYARPASRRHRWLRGARTRPHDRDWLYIQATRGLATVFPPAIHVPADVSRRIHGTVYSAAYIACDDRSPRMHAWDGVNKTRKNE